MMAQDLRVLVWYWGRRGGGALYTLEILRALKNKPGVTVHASLAAGNELLAASQAACPDTQVMTTYHNVPSLLAASLRLPKIRRDFAAMLRENRYDVVISTMGHLWTPFLAPLIRREGAAYIPTIHDASPHPGEFQPFWNRRLTGEARAATRVLTLSHAVGDIFAHATGMRRDHIHMIPFGIPSSPQDGGNHAAPRVFPQGRKFRFIFFGRIMAYKGVDLLLEAWALLRNTRDDVTLTIAGAGDVEPYRAQLASLPDITLINRWIAEDEIPDLLADADAVVLPYREASQSGVIGPAYAVGIPAAVTPVGGLSEQIADGETGIVAEAATPAAIAAAMLRLCDAEFYEHCARGVAAWRGKYGFAAQADDFVALFRAAAGGKS